MTASRARVCAALSDGGVFCLGIKQSGAGREENNLDSDYQPALMQEEGNVTMATKTTSQRHVNLALACQQTKSSHCAPACYAALRRAAAHSRSLSKWENIRCSTPPPPSISEVKVQLPRLNSNRH